ncbi:MAG TPA: hypothetical protein EYQ20_18440 [candidate division Zixibacteria bacterium]|jgi:hypothetical protein|nr:hypothetical protein [Candidatus Latescibacterota bacterium]MDP7237401.1 hypothetical protein [Candidatus Latescibacterota bacterium]HIG48305.1 hypothetical protein [candidate division Zixibacteria bacterium]
MTDEKQYNLRAVRIIQWTSGTIGFFTIGLIYLILLPGWRRIKNALGVKIHSEPQATPHVPSPDTRPRIE